MKTKAYVMMVFIGILIAFDQLTKYYVITKLRLFMINDGYLFGIYGASQFGKGIIIIISLILVLKNTETEIVHTQKMPISVSVADYLGINVDSDSLKFGTIPPGSNGKRKITIINPFNLTVKAETEVQGEIKDWISYYPTTFYLNQNKGKEIEITINIPENQEFGNYSGTFAVVFKS